MARSGQCFVEQMLRHDPAGFETQEAFKNERKGNDGAGYQGPDGPSGGLYDRKQNGVSGAVQMTCRCRTGAIIGDDFPFVGRFGSWVGRISQKLWITLCKTSPPWAPNPRQIVKITNRSHFEQKKIHLNQRLARKNQRFGT